MSVFMRCAALPGALATAGAVWAQADFPAKAVRLATGTDLTLAVTSPNLAAQGVDVLTQSPDPFSAFRRSEYSKWQKVIRATGIRAA